MDIQTLIYITIGLGTLIIAQTVAIVLLNTKIRKLLRGPASSIEESVTNIIHEIDGIQEFRKELEPYLSNVERRLKRSFQGHHTLRFDPFRGDGSGGSQSFATAFINEDGDGIILSSLNSRDRMNVYSKPIKRFESEFELTQEEKEALSKAKESCKL